ncbi:caspase, EACC1-associated type [Streptomyces canus]|uniref:caspase, EACC1-associated type n=1 Tax=Streptomyces canus TaxID=58343 RepID=UPI0033B614DB
MAGTREALLIATGRYDNPVLNVLRSPTRDSEGLGAVLGDPEIGDFRVEQVNDAYAHEIAQALERFFRNRRSDDLLLLHLSCHGIKDDNGRLFFAARNTDKDLPASTAISAEFLRELMKECRARTIVLLLDCCYSGAFMAGAKGDDSIHVRDELAGHGRAVITATNRTEYAWEGNRLDTLTPQPSRFTGALIDGLRTGAADRDDDGWVTVNELYDYVCDSLSKGERRQTPRLWMDLEFRVAIARVPGRKGSSSSPQRDSPPGSESPPEESSAPRRVVSAPHAPASPSDSPRRPSATLPRNTPPREKEGIRRRVSRQVYGPRGPRGLDAVVRLEISLNETLSGVVKPVRIASAGYCPVCDGTGARSGTMAQKCLTCSGSGHTITWTSCADCRGFGIVASHPCLECGGEGRLRSHRMLMVTVPPGARDGVRLRLNGEGEVGPFGGPPGDVNVEVTIRSHPQFTLTGDDLHCTVQIPRRLAVRGGVVEVDTLDGIKKMRVPAGIHSGQVFRLKGLGIPQMNASGRGHLYVRLEIGI